MAWTLTQGTIELEKIACMDQQNRVHSRYGQTSTVACISSAWTFLGGWREGNRARERPCRVFHAPFNVALHWIAKRQLSEQSA